MTKTPSPKDSIPNVGLPKEGSSWWEEASTEGDPTVEIIAIELDFRATRPLSIIQALVSNDLHGLLEHYLPPAVMRQAGAMLGVLDNLLTDIQTVGTKVVGRSLAQFPRATGTLEETLQESFAASGYDLDKVKLMVRDALVRCDIDGLEESLPSGLDIEDPEAVWAITYPGKKANEAEAGRG